MLKDFGKEIQQVWDTGILGTNLGEIFLAISIFLVFIICAEAIFSDHHEVTQINGQEN